MHVNNVAVVQYVQTVVGTHCLDVFVRRIPTVHGYFSRFLTKFSAAVVVNRKWISGAVPRVSDVVCR